MTSVFARRTCAPSRLSSPTGCCSPTRRSRARPSTASRSRGATSCCTASGSRSRCCARSASRIVTCGARTSSSTPHGQPWVIDFGFSELAVSDDRLAQDVAQLLAALSIVVGPERAVDSAVGVIGPEAVGTALPFLQPPAFAGRDAQGVARAEGSARAAARNGQRSHRDPRGRVRAAARGSSRAPR